MTRWVCTILICFIALGSSEPVKWTLDKNTNGIKIYTADVSGYPVKAIRAEFEFYAGLAQVVAVIMDPASFPEWIYRCKKTRMLKNISPREFIYYHVTSAMWPADDRDQISKFTLSGDPARSVKVTSRSIKDYLPEQEGCVRVQKSNAMWNLTPLPGGKIKAEYELYFDPAGNVPAWMINLFISEGPYQTFDNMRRQVKLAKYKDVSINDFFNP